jgi:hypothetical protein
MIGWKNQRKKKKNKDFLKTSSKSIKIIPAKIIHSLKYGPQRLHGEPRNDHSFENHPESNPLKSIQSDQSSNK